MFQSALRDRRFNPIEPVELPQLECSVSLLTNYESAQHYKDWEIGTHGIMIHFSSENRDYSATYLPEVASEQQWDHDTTIESLMRKAGYRQHTIPQALKDTIKVTRYQSSKISLTYPQYVQHKEIEHTRH